MLTLSLGMGVFPAAAAEAQQQPQPPARGAQMQEQFDRLTQAQKDEIYALAQSVSEASQQLIAKYAEFGLIGEQAAQKLCEGMQKHLEDARSAGKPVGLLPVRPAQKGPKN